MNPMTIEFMHGHHLVPSSSLGMQGIPRWGVIFPKVFRHFVYSPCNLLVKPGLLVACIAPHQYLSGAAISPPGCIPGRYAPKTQLLLKIGSGISPFQFCASWRTSSDNSCHPVAFPSSNWFLTTQVAPKTLVFFTLSIVAINSGQSVLIVVPACVHVRSN